MPLYAKSGFAASFSFGQGIQEIYDAALELAPDYDADKIVQRINGKRIQRQESLYNDTEGQKGA